MDHWDVLLQQVINGVSLGAMYALLALGFTMVYGIIELINFAHFNVFMVGSFVAMWVMQAMGFSGQAHVLHGLPLIGLLMFVLAVTMLVTGTLGALIERYGLRALRGVSGPAPMITTIGLSYILFNDILLTTGADSKNYSNPMPNVRWEVGGAVLRLREVLLWAIAIALMAALHYFVRRTKMGKAMQATAQDQEAARMVGVDVDSIVIITFFIGSVLGGIGNIPGAMLGGVVIGLIESLGGQYLAVRWTDVIIFSILVLVLVFRPTGLLGSAAPTKS